MPGKDPQTAASWRRTRHLGEEEALAILDKCEEAGLVNPTIGYRIMASLRYLAMEQPELVSLEEQREGHRVIYTVDLQPGTNTKKRRKGG